jgi:lambda family phage tail tape measure protein
MSIMASFRDGAKGMFTSVLTGAQSFKGALSGVLGSIGNNLISGGVGQLFDAIWPFAKGGVINSGNVVPFAKGGVVNSPTLFGMSGNNTGLMGEAGPEAIMPLTRGPDGSLGVRAQGGGGGTVVHISYAPVIDARGADQAAVVRLQAQLEAQAANLERNVHKILINGNNRRTNNAWSAR